MKFVYDKHHIVAGWRDWCVDTAVLILAITCVPSGEAGAQGGGCTEQGSSNGGELSTAEGAATSSGREVQDEGEEQTIPKDGSQEGGHAQYRR